MTENAFQRYFALGYKNLVPVIPHDAEISPRSTLFGRIGTSQDARGKVPGVKGQNGTWFSFDWTPHTTTEPDLSKWHSMGAGVGIRTGDGLVAIDADTMDADSAKIIFDQIKQTFGKLPLRIGNYPKALYLIRVNGQFQYQRIEFGPPRENNKGRLWRVEVLSDKKFFVAEGIHPKTKKPYEWKNPPIPFEDLPVVTPGAISDFLNALRPLLPDSGELIREGGSLEAYDQDALKGDLELVRKAVNATPNTTELFPSRESYRDYGYAIKAALPDHPNEAFDIWASWCERWDGGDNDPDVMAADWSRMNPPFRRGASWLYDLAEEHSGGKFSTAEIWLEDYGPEPDPAENSSKRFYNFEAFGDVVEQPLESAPPLIDGLLDQGALSVAYGDSNAGKTFVVMGMGFHIATGTPYAGMDVTQGPVVYIAAEGGAGAKKRIKALKDRYPDANPDFLLLASPIDLRRPDADLKPLTEALRALVRELGRSISFLVIDTLSRAMAGGDENSSVDMGAIVKHVDLLRKAISPAHVMFVHHTGKDRARGARGHSLLRAATDTEIEIEAIEGVKPAAGSIRVTKQRDMDGGWEQGFRLRVHTLGLKANGKPVTSCTVDLVGVEEVAAVAAKPTAREREVLSALGGLVDETGEPVTTKEIAARIVDVPSKKDVETTRSHLRNLETKCLVERLEGGKWAKKAVENASTASGFSLLAPEKAVESGRNETGDLFH